MEKTRLHSLLGYTFDMNAQFLTYLKIQNFKASHEAIRFMWHILSAHHLWNNRIEGKMHIYDLWAPPTGIDLEMINRENCQKSKAFIDKSEVNSSIHYKTTEGQFYENTIDEILFHVVNHSTHHRAQISLLLRQCDIEPIASDYIFYLRKKGV
jgi:uncharacterized damage-inducible protein DinB